jgi:hypothetical protein
VVAAEELPRGVVDGLATYPGAGQLLGCPVALQRVGEVGLVGSPRESVSSRSRLVGGQAEPVVGWAAGLARAARVRSAKGTARRSS